MAVRENGRKAQAPSACALRSGSYLFPPVTGVQGTVFSPAPVRITVSVGMHCVLLELQRYSILTFSFAAGSATHFVLLPGVETQLQASENVSK